MMWGHGHMGRRSYDNRGRVGEGQLWAKKWWFPRKARKKLRNALQVLQEMRDNAHLDFRLLSPGTGTVRQCTLLLLATQFVAFCHSSSGNKHILPPCFQREETRTSKLPYFYSTRHLVSDLAKANSFSKEWLWHKWHKVTHSRNRFLMPSLL